MLETIREYGLEQLAAAGEEASVRRRHLAWFADFAERCQPGVFGPEGPAWLDRMAADLDNLRAAMAWSVTDPTSGSARAGLRIAGAAHQLWLYRDNLAEGQHWLELTLAADEAQSPGTGQETPLPAARFGAQGVHPRVIALNSLGVLRRTQGRVAEAASPHRQALVLSRAVRGSARGGACARSSRRTRPRTGRARERSGAPRRRPGDRQGASSDLFARSGGRSSSSGPCCAGWASTSKHGRCWKSPWS